MTRGKRKIGEKKKLGGIFGSKRGENQ